MLRSTRFPRLRLATCGLTAARAVADAIVKGDVRPAGRSGYAGVGLRFEDDGVQAGGLDPGA